MFSILMIILGMVLFFFLINVAMAPGEFAVMRSAIIFAPQSQVFANVNDLRMWKAWSPWARLDPEAKYTFAGPDHGKGAAMVWDGNGKVSKGKMTIIDNRPEDYVKIKLDFVRPFPATNIAELSFVPLETGGVQATWLMTGHNNFFMKIMWRVMKCEQMIGGQFEQGFMNLKEVVEVKPAA